MVMRAIAASRRVGVCLARLPGSATARLRGLPKRAAVALGVCAVVVVLTALSFVVFYAIGRWGGSLPEPTPAEVASQALGDSELPPLPSLHALPALRAGRTHRSNYARGTGASSKSGGAAGDLPQSPTGSAEGGEGDAEKPNPAPNAPVATHTTPEVHVTTVATVNK